ncbi:MAG TPA: MarR family transcriptional regulator, partial [Candidatus Acidoferrales bacterium]|nr:MarR family transcriptional regulator [Candidatus Acidoferrales bacterium]
YMVLIDTADWIKGELRGPLDSFDVTLGEFRVMEILDREGALPLTTVAGRRQVKRSGIRRTVNRLERRGWLKRLSVTLPPAEFKRMHRARSRRDELRRGQRICVIGLTKAGKKFMGNLLPSHSKLVKALMRALHAREQESLVRICEKLREGDVLKFVTELRWVDETEFLREKAMYELERLEGRMRRRGARALSGS